MLDNLKQKYDSNERVQNETKTVLVAPSWGKSGILSKYGDKFLSSLKDTGFKIIVRPHPQTVVSEQDILKPLEEKFACFEWNYDNDNFAVLNRADILITDFSGIIHDYTFLCDKPVIYVNADLDLKPYDAYDLPSNGKDIWQFAVLKKIGIELKEDNFAQIKEII